MYFQNVYILFLQLKSEEAIKSHATTISDILELLCGCWETNPGPP